MSTQTIAKSVGVTMRILAMIGWSLAIVRLGRKIASARKKHTEVMSRDKNLDRTIESSMDCSDATAKY